MRSLELKQINFTEGPSSTAGNLPKEDEAKYYLCIINYGKKKAPLVCTFEDNHFLDSNESRVTHMVESYMAIDELVEDFM